MAPERKTVAARFTVPAVAALSLALDLLTKTWARSSLSEATRTPFIPGLVQFALTTNTGAAFSLGSSNMLLMSSLATVMTLALIGWAAMRERGKEEMHTLDRLGLGCLIGGALGNLLDRYTRGRVTDFLDFTFISFPVFNVADMLIDLGIGFLILSTLIHKPQRGTKAGIEGGTNKTASEKTED